jgi:hypothetical protein
VGEFAAGASPSDAASPSEAKRQMAVAKVDTVTHK